MLRVYRLLNLLSLDVAAGAMITTLFFSKLLHAPVRAYGVVALGLTVWIIYTADRLLDVRHLKQPALSERHRFHQQYYTTLWVVVLSAIVLVCVLISFVRPAVLLGGLLLAPVIVLYLLLQKRLPIKELAVATLYTMGVLVPAWPGSWMELMPVTGLIAQLFLIALANLMLFAWFEAAEDNQMGQASLATRIGKNEVGKFLITLLGFGISFSLVHAVLVNSNSWILFFMWVGLIALFYFKTYFERNERYRVWGDAIFYLPIIGLL